jgi:hypothetical protein
VADDDAPKTAYEIALERLRKKDREEGVEERPLSDQQRNEIADIRKIYEARFAECEILYRSSLSKVADPAELETLEEQYRRDRRRLGSERDSKIEKVRERDA